MKYQDESELDQVRDMLAHFICADAVDQSLYEFTRFDTAKSKTVGFEVDAGARLPFAPRKPTTAYTCDLVESRDVATVSELLLNTPQDILGCHAEIALVSDTSIKWACFRKLAKRPRGIWVAKSGASLYEYHSRFIRPDGSSDYAKRVAAIDKNGKPVQVIIEGTKNQGNVLDGLALVMASSIIEDANRPGTFKATIKDSVGVIFPVRQGHHLELFKLRDGPTMGSRKRPLLHWVAAHMRRNTEKEFEVKSYLRGIHEFVIDGMAVKLDAKE